MVNTVSYACSACGKCCDSPPAMTMAELFRHEDVFVGCLAVHRVPSMRAGDVTGPGATPLTPEDIDATASLADRLHHRVAPGAQGPWFGLRTQGHDYASLAACPARAPDGRCSLHGAGKLATCVTVPLDAHWPDRLQHVVLGRRLADAAYIGAECLTPGLHPNRPVLLADGRIVDAAERARLAQQRDALAGEKAEWGDAVAALLRPALFAGPGSTDRLPAAGYLSLPLTPVLEVLADRSAAAAERCVRHAERQIALIEANIASALRRKQAADRAFTQELRRSSEAYRQFVRARAAAPHGVAA